jgi:hypothetical protein
VQHGHCLCGAVRFEVRGALRPVIFCHCEMCRRASGHFVAATACPRTALHLVSADTLRWFVSSEHARRGFCSVCGSQLFWEPIAEGYVSIMAGALDRPTGLKASGHIFVESAGDYYELSDRLPKQTGNGELASRIPQPG